MPMPEIVLEEKAPLLNDFIELRSLIGWTCPSDEIMRRSIEKSLYCVTIYSKQRLIAMGRVVGDGEMYFYIQDVLVNPEYQGKGHGSAIMGSIDHYLSKKCNSGSTIGLLAAKGKEGFYRQFGYSERDGRLMGLGMCKFI